ncbi:MAG: hypothetical protein HW405_93 [Candidatus Berkelbacteria bacterium]|nr:hypothetical protein [Candidatus Berkelbacteria bacterium]
MKTIVLGSSMKFRSIVKDVLKELKTLGFNAVFPNIGCSNLNSDIAKTAKEKKQMAFEHYKVIEKADAVYFILPNGYMGTSCKIELGYALAYEKPIYFSELTNQADLDCYIKKIIPLDKLELFKKEDI